MRRKKIVTIGGGTGSFTLLSGLKKYPVDISAVVSTADDGSSGGTLRDELGVLPPGDIRQCLVAFSNSSRILRALMNYRFESGGLKGHAFGNIFLSALEKISKNFTEGIQQAAEILNVKGEVLPMSKKSVRLHIKLKNGKILVGEKQLDHNESIRKIGIESVFLKPPVVANEKAVKKIRQADAIVIGPGDLYGSVLPILLVKGISEAIKKSKAKIIYNCNLTNKKGQTENFTIDSYVQVLEKHIGKGKINFVTFNSKMIARKLVNKYEKREGKNSVIVCLDKKAKNKSYKLIMADLLGREKIAAKKSDPTAIERSFIRHDSDKLAKALMGILKLGDRKTSPRK